MIINLIKLNKFNNLFLLKTYMQQNLLEKWLNVKPRNSNIKDVFYIKWNRKKPTISYWTTKINKNTNFSIKLNGEK